MPEEPLAATPTIYDEVPYRTLARPATHPDRMAVLGRLFGLECAHPNAARVLELGCGDGSNLIPMALSLPGSEFVGVDLAPTAVERGNQRAAAAGISNVQLETADIAALGPEIGEFDYIVAHGVFSWVPVHVREAILRLIQGRMRPTGVAFISYNALPGDQIRGVVRHMMKVHTSGIESPAEKMREARGLLDLLALAPGSAANIYGPLLATEIGHALRSSDDTLFHDDLADLNQSFYFSEFMDLARAHDLQFLAETPFHMMSAGALPPEMVQVLRDMAARDIVLKEQYLDFFTCKGFRQTLLCHASANLSRTISTDRMRQFRYVSAANRAEEPDGRPGVVAFKHENGSSIRTDNPATIRAMESLKSAWPRSIPFEDLAATAGAEGEAAVQALAGSLFQMFGVGLLELRLHEPEFVSVVSERPVASPWARLGAGAQDVANLFHEMVELNETSAALLPLADGSRTVKELAGALNKPEADVDHALASVARLGLLVG